MEWAKAPVVAGSMMCAACLAVATAVPAGAPVAEQLTKTVHSGVNLAVDFSALDWLSALAATGPADLASLDGIPAFQEFLATGDLAAFEPAADGSGGYAALSGLNSYATGNLAGIDGFSTLGVSSLGDIDAFSAIPVYQSVLAGGPDGGVNALGGLASVSAVDTFFGDNNGDGGVFTGGGIDALAPDADGNGGYAALSALPVFVGETGPNGDGGVFTGGGIDALSGYDALSAIPAYLAPTPPAVTTLAASEQAATEDSAPAARLAPQTLAAPVAEAPVVEKTTAPEADKKPTGSYSASFKPQPLVLFGSGGGKNAADNGIRGWGDMLKKAGLAPADGTDAADGAGTP